MPWSAGQSGNPKGLKKSPLRVKFEARIREECTEEAVRALKRACEQDESWAVQLALAYGYGKPSEHVELDVRDESDAVKAMPTVELLKLVKSS